MNFVGKVVCRTVGIAGMSIALADSYKVAKKYSGVGGKGAQSRYLEKGYFNSRTTDRVSYSASAIGEKAFDLKTKNPLPAIGGKIKGGFSGFLYGLGSYLPAIICSLFALFSKKWPAKIGAAGVALGIVYKIAHEGFGLGKHNPIN